MSKTCSSIHAKPIIVVSENKSRVEFRNPDRLQVEEVQVDGCLITSGQRCDYLLNVLETNKIYLVELKGSDIPHAIQQLRVTHNLVKKSWPKRYTWIVCPVKTHPQFTTQIQKEQLSLRRQGIHLISRNSPISIDI